MKKFLMCLFLVCNMLILFGCDVIIKEDYNLPEKEISTKANYTFFPTERSSLHKDELKEAYEKYKTDNNINLESWGEYEIYSFISESDSKKYNLDIFEVCYVNGSYYYIKYKSDMYSIVPFDLGNPNSHCMTHLAITDINDDGYIEVLTAINSFADRGSYYYCTSFMTVVDTFTKCSMDVTNYKNINYFKENEDGVICIYNANGKVPVVEDLHNGKLDEKYYDLADNLFDTPVLNTSKYEFKEQFVKTSCELYEVEITITEGSINFPYLFKTAYPQVSFNVNVKMTYLGKPFSYTSPDTYLDGATVTFVNNTNEILCEGWAAGEAITKFHIFTGQVIERTYKYNEDLNDVNEVGLYDMVITYANEETKLSESITIKDFLKVKR